jgi:hypothetical protein
MKRVSKFVLVAIAGVAVAYPGEQAVRAWQQCGSCASPVPGVAEDVRRVGRAKLGQLH